MPSQNLENITVQFWGMPGQYSYLVLEGLLAAAVDIRAVVVAASSSTAGLAPIMRLTAEPIHSQLPISSPYLQTTVNHLAWRNQIPLFQVADLSAAEVVRKMTSFEGDLSIVACFPNRIPQKILDIPPHGFLNLHPSLLPDLRGPYPLFWTFRLGKKNSGITVHHMDAGLDTGAIALQHNIPLPDGISGPEADSLFAKEGARLLAVACQQLAAGTLPRIPQHDRSSTFSRPTAKDFYIPTTWSARHAYNFICGTADWRQPFRIIGRDLDLTVRRAISFDAAASQPEAVRREGRDFWIQFMPGLLHAH